MKIIPILRCNDLKEAVAFYTNVLDFMLKYPDDPANEWAISLVKKDAEILLASRDGTPRIAIIVKVDDVDAAFKKYVDRGLIVPNNPDSPVHNAMREFYVNDPSGNTLRFAAPIV